MIGNRAGASGLALIVAVASLGLTGCGNGAALADASRKTATPAAPPRSVRLVAVKPESLPRSVTATGTLAADEEVVASFKVAGYLSELPVDLGSRVNRGDVIARLDPTDFEWRLRQAEVAVEQAQARLGLSPESPNDRIEIADTAIVRQARATREEARAKFERQKSLFDQQLLPRSDFDTASAALTVAEGRLQDALEEAGIRITILAGKRVELEIARQQLSYTTLVAPISGSIRLRSASVGQYLAIGEPVVTIVKTNPLRLRLAIPERESRGVLVSQPVRVTVGGDPSAYSGRIVRISPAIAEESRTLLIEAEVPNEDGALRVGSFAEAEITTGDNPAILVPRAAVVTFAGVEKVFTVRDGRAAEIRVETGRLSGDRVELVKGLEAGASIVADPGNLVGGQSVTVDRE